MTAIIAHWEGAHHHKKDWKVSLSPKLFHVQIRGKVSKEGVEYTLNQKSFFSFKNWDFWHSVQGTLDAIFESFFNVYVFFQELN